MTTDYGPAPLASLERVEWRVDGKPTQGQQGPRARFVPYIDARDVAALLDQWVGPLNWRARFEETTIGGKPAMWGIVEVRDPQNRNEWISKRDVGVPSNFEPAKGLVSDAFKRAGCVQWGCGRNVYDLPSVWAPCRVTGSGDKAKAWPVKETMPVIRAQLKEQGYETTGGRATGVDPTADPETGESPLPDEPPAPPAPPEAAQRPERPADEMVTRADLDHLSTVMADLTDAERARIKAEREERGFSIKPGQFTVGTLQWLIGRAGALLQQREALTQLGQAGLAASGDPGAQVVAVEKDGRRYEPAPGGGMVDVGPAGEPMSEDQRQHLTERAQLVRQDVGPEDGGPLGAAPPADAGAARRQAGGAKLASKVQRETVAKQLGELTEAKRAEVEQWAQGAGHRLGDQLAADSFQPVMTAIANVRRTAPSGRPSPRAPKAPSGAPAAPQRPAQPVQEEPPAPDPDEVRRELRRVQWQTLNDAVEALGVEETWPMLVEELVKADIALEGATLANVTASFIGAGADFDEWVGELVEQYKAVADEYQGRPYEEAESKSIAGDFERSRQAAAVAQGTEDVDY